MLDPETEKFYQTLFAKRPKGHLTLAQVRMGFEKLMVDFPAEPDVHFHPLSIGKLSAAWVHAPGCTREKVLLFFHGGGYLAGSFHSHQDMIGRLAKATGCEILAVDYRLAPEHPFPAALEDALISYDYLCKTISQKNVFIAGSSAGGGLTISLLLKLLEKKEVLPRGAICISPWLDLSLTGKTLLTNEGKDLLHSENLKVAVSIYLNGHDPKDPLVSPLYGKLEGLPPLLIQVGSRELFLDEIEQFAKKAEKSGVSVTLQIFDEMIHTWHLFTSQISEGQKALDEIGLFCKKI